MQGKKQDRDTLQAYQAIMQSNLSPVDKVKEAFTLVTDFYIEHGEREIELLRAMGDRENLVKEQIKVSTMRSVQDIFAEAYRQANSHREV